MSPLQTEFTAVQVTPASVESDGTKHSAFLWGNCSGFPEYPVKKTTSGWTCEAAAPKLQSLENLPGPGFPVLSLLHETPPAVRRDLYGLNHSDCVCFLKP